MMSTWLLMLIGTGIVLIGGIVVIAIVTLLSGQTAIEYDESKDTTI